MQDRGPGWRANQLRRERAIYFALVNAGVGFREAARRAGVDYRLTKRWRAAQRPTPATTTEIRAKGDLGAVPQRRGTDHDR
jgi:hypothetical protein